MKTNYEVYENNAGGLALLVYENGNPMYLHTGYEFMPGQLTEDIRALTSGAIPVSEWDGNEIDDVPIEEITKGALDKDATTTYWDAMGSAAHLEFGEKYSE